MKSNKKKGFTIVELVIVIAVIGILAAVLIPMFTRLIRKSRINTDTQLIRNLNTALESDKVEVEHKTMTSALDAAKAYGYDIAKINASATNNEILWDSENDVFCYYNEGELEYLPDSVDADKKLKPNSYKLWKIYTDAPKEGEKYSIYVAGQGAADYINTNDVNVGVDCGDYAVTTVSYKNTGDARDVVIRTNSANTTLTIDDESTGTIYHYGSAGALNIIQCHTASYHENGNVAFAEIATGRIVLESGSEIKQIHINKKTTSTFDTVIITDNGAKELPEKITRDEVSVASATQVVVVEPKGAPAETVYVYPDGSTGHIGTTEKTETQNTTVESPLGQLVLDNGSSGDKALTEEQKDDNKEEVIEVAKDNEKADVSVKVTINDVSTLMSLAEFRNNVNNDVEGYKTANVELMCNINLGGIDWDPIKEFSGVFDGKGFTISNYTVNTPNDKTGTGLFKKLSGEVNSEFNAVSDVYNSTTHEFSESKISENKYTCVVKNLKLSNVTTNANHGVSNSRFTAGLTGIAVNAYISNIEVSKSTINVNKYGAAVVGTMSGTVIKDVTVSSNVNVIGTGSGAGHVAGVVGESGNAQGTRINAIVNATNNATITGYYGNNAGISGMGKAIVHYNCVNNGNINISNSNNACGGITGNADASYFIKCTNNGNINATNIDNPTGVTKDKEGIGGICGFHQNAGTSLFHECYNYGDITNTGTASLAGIAMDGSASNTYYEVANYGVLTGPNAVAIYDISSNINSVLTITGSKTIKELMAELNSNNASSVNVTAEITGELGTIVLPSNTRVFSASSAVATAFDLSQLAGNRVTINMPGSFELVNINGKSVTISGNSNVTVGSSENGGSVSLRGQVTSLTNNGTLEHVYFTGTGVYTLTNNGTISHTQSESEIYGNKHTIDSITACTITIHNYGTIEANKNSNGVCSYALLFYNGCNVTFYAYENSVVSTDSTNHMLLAIQNGTTITFLYKAGARFVNGTTEYSYPLFHWGGITVSKINN